MNGLNLYITVSAVTLGLLSAIFNFTGRQKYKDQTSFFQSSNAELREQNVALKDDKATLVTELAKTQAESSQKDKTIEQLKPFNEVVRTMSNNHKEVMKSLASLAKAITGKVDGK